MRRHLTIRTAVREDLVEVFKIEDEAFGVGHSLAPYGLVQYFDLFPGHFLVACDDVNTIVGFCVSGVCAPPENNVGWLLDVAISAAHRRLGAGRALLREAVERLRDVDVRRVRATVSEHNAASLNMLRNEGLQQVARVDDYFGPGNARLIMEKEIPS